MTKFRDRQPSSEGQLLRLKGLKFLYMLTFALVLAILSVYYFRLGRQIETHSHNQVSMAFELILDDLKKRRDELKPKLEQFTRTSLAGPLYMTQLIQQETEQQEQTGAAWQVRKLMPHLSSVAHEIRKLGQELAASEILVYNTERNLIAVYWAPSQHKSSGVYLSTLSGQAFIPIESKENWLPDLQNLSELPQQMLPEGLPRLYQKTLPEALDIKITSIEGKLSLELIVPIMERNNIAGVCVCYIELSQRDVERYSRLSQTRVNLFSGSDLSVGTLPEYDSIPEGSLKQLQAFDVYDSAATPQISYSKVTISGKHYYQGLLNLKDQQRSFGTIAVQFPRYLEERRQGEFSILIFSVILLFGFLYKDIRRAEKIEALNQELKTRATELENANRQLSSEIRERKKMETALHSAKNAAEAANRAKSQFLANMSHELRTPLNAILGYAQLLHDASALSDLQQRGLTTISHSGEHLLNLINEILDLSKIEAGRMELQEHASLFPEFLKSLAEMIRIRAQQKHIHFSFECDPNVPAGVLVDAKRLRQVLLNLLGNAVKLTDRGRVTFRVTCVADGDQGLTPDRASQQTMGDRPFDVSLKEQYTTIVFEVEDTGPGIPPEFLQEIFHPFHQLPEHRTSIQGTGLGLTISQKLVKMMGGTIKVRSTVGEGSTFSFALALQETTHKEQAAETSQARVIGYSGPRRTLLVVDDTAANRTLLKDSLAPLGFQIIEAEDGEEGLRIATRVSPDVILLDLVMPKMDGFELARQIRKCEGIRHTPLIAISATVFDETRERSLEAGCDDFITKPFSMEKLLELLAQQLQMEWIYEDTEQPSGAKEFFPGTYLLDTLRQLPDERRQALLHQAHRGDPRGLLNELERIEELGEQVLPFVNDLRALVQSFQIDRILTHLSPEDEKETESWPHPQS